MNLISVSRDYRSFIIVFCFVCKVIFANAQSVTLTVDLDFDTDNKARAVRVIDLSAYKNRDFIAVSVVIEGEGLDRDGIKGYIKTNKTHILTPSHEGERTSNRYTSELCFLKPEEAVLSELSIDAGINNALLDQIKGKLRIFIPESVDLKSAGLHPHRHILEDSCNCTGLPYITRNVWGTAFHLDSSIYIKPAVYTKVTHLIIHHSAGTNFSDNWAGVVAAYFDYHVNSNGWQDIGYNWLIDPNGVLYEGRGGGDNVQGAHMCGYNRNSMSVCMLGNFEVTTPTDTMTNTLIRLLGYKACKDNINPLGDGDIASYPGHMFNISGHKDGCSPGYTSCPGKFLYAELNGIRNATHQYIEDACDSLSDTKDYLSHSVLYPNPATHTICGLNNVFRLTNIYGQEMDVVYPFREENCIDISGLQPGRYFVRQIENGHVMISSFIKI